MIWRAGRSFTDCPGFMNSALPRIVQPVAAATLDFTERSNFGLMRLAGFTGALEFVATFVLLDLSFYYWHVANHRVAFLWRFHNVHHIDPDLAARARFNNRFVQMIELAGRIHEVYASSVSRAWVVLRAESTEEAERVLAELPFSHHVHFEVE